VRNPAREELTRRIDALEAYIDEIGEPGPGRSRAFADLARLREEHDAMDRDQRDLIAHVLAFARGLSQKTPDRLAYKWDDGPSTRHAKTIRQLERERVGAELVRLLEEGGVDIHEGEEQG